MGDSTVWAPLVRNRLFHGLFFAEDLILGSEEIHTPLNTRPEISTSAHADQFIVLLPEAPDHPRKAFLDKILTACGLAQNQTVTHTGHQTRESIGSFAEARLILSFGAIAELEPTHMRHQRITNLIACHSLARLEADAASKKLLWNSLKKALSK